MNRIWLVKLEHNPKSFVGIIGNKVGAIRLKASRGDTKDNWGFIARGKAKVTK